MRFYALALLLTVVACARYASTQGADAIAQAMPPPIVAKFSASQQGQWKQCDGQARCYRLSDESLVMYLGTKLRELQDDTNRPVKYNGAFTLKHLPSLRPYMNVDVWCFTTLAHPLIGHTNVGHLAVSCGPLIFDVDGKGLLNG